jgi:inorganic pyrophosphatase
VKECLSTLQELLRFLKNSRAKYELDKESGMLILDRVLYSSINYPANYGFIPQTYCDDGDPLDIMVLSQVQITPMCLVSARVIGVMRMLDEGEMDDKIIAVAENDMSVNHMNDISELPPHWRRELQSFFEDYKKLENKSVVVEDFQGKDVAHEVVLKSIEDYKAKFK